MEITHIMRGEEWVASVPKHLLIYRAFGWDVPPMAHFPSVLGPDDAEARVPRGECAKRRVVVARSDADPGRLPQRAQRVAVARAQIANLHRSPY